MGFFDSIGGFLKKAAPFTAFIPGVGPLAAAGIGFGGSLLDGDSAGDALQSGALGYLGGRGVQGIGGGGDGGSIFGRIGGLVRDNPDLALAGLGALNDARRGSQADGLRNEGLDLTRLNASRFMANQDDLLGRIRGLEASPVDLSSVYEDPGNPFYRPSPASSAGPVPPATPEAPRFERPRRRSGGAGSSAFGQIAGIPDRNRFDELI